MIAAYVQQALDAPLAARPNHLAAEVRYIAERDHCSLFSAALDQWVRERQPKPEPEPA